MARKRLQASTCCQMRRIVNGVDVGPSTGTGSGGDRCTEAVTAMIDATYQLGPDAKAGASTNQLMYEFVQLWNGPGAINSGLENFGERCGSWLASNGYSNIISLSNTHWPSFANIVIAIENGHCAVGGFNDYMQLRLADGTKPYSWTDPPGLGHVLLIVGYDSDAKTIAVHDPLLAESRQPTWYSWAGFQAAGFADCTEVVGPALPVVEGGSMVPQGPFYLVKGGHNGVPAVGNAVVAAFGITWSDLLAIKDNQQRLGAYDPNGPYLFGSPTDPNYGVEFWVPGFPPPVPDTSALQAQLTQAQTDLENEKTQVVKLTAQVQQLQTLLNQVPAPSGSATDTAALDELAKLLPSLTKALASRAAPALPTPVGVQTKPLPAVQ